MPVNLNFDPVQLGFGLYDRFGGQDTGVAGDDTRFMNDFAWKQSLRNEQFQNDLAQHGIKMRVDDAVSAGLHPLVGAGINPASGGYQGAAFTGVTPKYPPQPMGGMGVNISRAAAATSTADERVLRSLELSRAMAETEGSHIHNQILQKQLDELNKNPPMPAPPNKYITIMNERGEPETIMNPDLNLQDPLWTWGASFRKAFGGPDTLGITNTGDSNSMAPGWFDRHPRRK